MHTRGTGMQPVFPHPGGGFIHIVHHVIHNPLLFGRLPLCITRPRRWTCRAKNCIILHTPFFAQSGGGWRGGAGAPAGPCARLRGRPGFPMEGGSVRPKRAPRRLPRASPPCAPALCAPPPLPRRAACPLHTPAPRRPPPAPCRAPATPCSPAALLRCALPRRANRRALLPRCAQRERRATRHALLPCRAPALCAPPAAPPAARSLPRSPPLCSPPRPAPPPAAPRGEKALRPPGSPQKDITPPGETHCAGRGRAPGDALRGKRHNAARGDGVTRDRDEGHAGPVAGPAREAPPGAGRQTDGCQTAFSRLCSSMSSLSATRAINSPLVGLSFLP